MIYYVYERTLKLILAYCELERKTRNIFKTNIYFSFSSSLALSTKFVSQQKIRVWKSSKLIM